MPETGEVVLTQRVVRVRHDLSMFNVGRPQLLGDALIFRTANALVCCDLLGETRWVSKLTHVPEDVDPYLTNARAIGELIVHEGHVIVSTPGSPYVECVDVATGARVWRSTHTPVGSSDW